MWQPLVRRALFALAILVPAIPAAHAEGEAGIVLFANGDVTATSQNGVARELKRRSPVYAGDSLRTGAGARAQVRFTDGGIVALKPASELRIDDYAYRAGSSEQKSILSLLKGGFRTMTGAIGKQTRSDYRVNTPVATIGIRGTLYETSYVEGEGLSLGVWDGGISACNSSGCLDLGMNADHRFGFVPLNGPGHGQDELPPGIGGDVVGGEVDNALGKLADALLPRNGVSPDGLTGPAADLTRSTYPKVGYALVMGSGVVAANFASAGIYNDLRAQGPVVTDWALVDNASGAEFSAAAPVPCGVSTCASWSASVTNTFSGSPVVWGSWNHVDVGLAAGDTSPATLANNGYFVIADAVSPETVTSFGVANPTLYVYLLGGEFDMSGHLASSRGGSMAVDFSAGTVTGNLYVSDLTGNSWNLNLNGAVANGALTLGLGASSLFTPAGGVAGQERAVTGHVEGMFYGVGTVQGVLGGVDAATVGTNPLSGDVETLKGVFQMDVNGG